MDREAELRREYMASDYPSGAAGYRRFMVDKIAHLESLCREVVEAVDEVIADHEHCQAALPKSVPKLEGSIDKLRKEVG